MLVAWVKTAGSAAGSAAAAAALTSLIAATSDRQEGEASRGSIKRRLCFRCDCGGICDSPLCTRTPPPEGDERRGRYNLSSTGGLHPRRVASAVTTGRCGAQIVESGNVHKFAKDKFIALIAGASTCYTSMAGHTHHKPAGKRLWQHKVAGKCK